MLAPKLNASETSSSRANPLPQQGPLLLLDLTDAQLKPFIFFLGAKLWSDIRPLHSPHICLLLSVRPTQRNAYSLLLLPSAS